MGTNDRTDGRARDRVTRDRTTGQQRLHEDRPAPTTATGILRSLLFGAAVFTLAAMTGALLAGAAPAVPAALSGAGALERAGEVGAGPEAPGTGRAPDRAEVATVEPLRSQQAEAREASEAVFAQSMVYSGTAGLTLSIAGLVMVGRRRRFW